MHRTRYLAASLLCLTGFIHVSRLGMANAPGGIVTAFGVAYLIIGGMLFRNHTTAYYLGALVPFIGLCVGPMIWRNPPVLTAGLLGIVEVAAVVSCLLVIKHSRPAGRSY